MMYMQFAAESRSSFAQLVFRIWWSGVMVWEEREANQRRLQGGVRSGSSLALKSCWCWDIGHPLLYSWTYPPRKARSGERLRTKWVHNSGLWDSKWRRKIPLNNVVFNIHTGLTVSQPPFEIPSEDHSVAFQNNDTLLSPTVTLELDKSVYL